MEPKPTSDLVQIVTLLVPVLTLAITAYIAYKQGQMRDTQSKQVEDQSRQTERTIDYA